MKTVEISTDLPRSLYETLAMNAAVELGWNCYSKPAGMPDEVGDDPIFYYKWHGKLLAIAIKSACK